MGLKFNFSKVPLRWRLLIGVQLGISGVIIFYRQTVVARKLERDR